MPSFICPACRATVAGPHDCPGCPYTIIHYGDHKHGCSPECHVVLLPKGQEQMGAKMYDYHDGHGTRGNVPPEDHPDYPAWLAGGEKQEPKMDGPKITQEDLGPARDQQEGALYDQLATWWRDLSYSDMGKTVPKALEYGSADLKVMGAAMVALHPNVDAMDEAERERTGQEMAVAFYLLGKVSRLFGAYQAGGKPSDDTWLDATVYSMMGRRIRETGGWPS